MSILKFKKHADIKAVERTLKLLAGYHAMPLDNGQFLSQYRGLITMYFVLCRELSSTPILPSPYERKI